MEHFTSEDISRQLVEHGLDPSTADMHYRDGEYIMKPYKDLEDKSQATPVWTDGKLFELMPKIHGRRPSLCTGKTDPQRYYVEYPYNERTKSDWYTTRLNDDVIAACVEMIAWLLAKKLI